MAEPRLTALLSLVSALAVTPSCTGDPRIIEIREPRDGGDAGGNGEAMPWGEFAATLDVPECPASDYPPLVVDTTADELDGGEGITEPSQAGEYLSFVEAMWIADNREGPDTILFDRNVFPSEEAATIPFFTSNIPIPDRLQQVCIDGRNRGVIIEFPEDRNKPFWELDDALLVGLTLLNPCDVLHMYDNSQKAHSQIAGCRVGTDGYQIRFGCHDPGYEMIVLTAGGTVGPGNVIGAPGNAIRVLHVTRHPLVVLNYLGYDPITHLDLGMQGGFDIMGGVVIAENVILSHGSHGSPLHMRYLGDMFGDVVVYKNRFNVDRTGNPLTREESTSRILLDNAIVNFESNIVRGQLTGVEVGRNALVTITRNSISGNGEGIVFTGTPPVDPPTITSASTARVSGTCPVAGTVEVFSDPGDQGETFLGDVHCDVTTPWSIDASVPRGMNVTATLTDGDGRTSGFSEPYNVP